MSDEIKPRKRIGKVKLTIVGTLGVFEVDGDEVCLLEQVPFVNENGQPVQGIEIERMDEAGFLKALELARASKAFYEKKVAEGE